MVHQPQPPAPGGLSRGARLARDGLRGRHLVQRAARGRQAGQHGAARLRERLRAVQVCDLRAARSALVRHWV